MGLVRAGLNQMVDVADTSFSKFLEAVGEAENGLVDTGHGAINVGDKTFDAVMEEGQELRARLAAFMKKVVDVIPENPVV